MGKSIEERVANIEARNKRVETDKAWEVSFTRRLTIALLTYVVIVSYLVVIDNDKPFVNALVPVAGYLLSTLVVRSVRKIWQKTRG